jgi:Zn-dependent protease
MNGSSQPPILPPILPPVLPPYSAPVPGPPQPPTFQQRLKRFFAPVTAVLVLIAKFFGSLKLAALPLLKFLPVLLKTGGSMAISIGIYAFAYGFWFAVGFVLLIFVHESGHLVAARRLGLKVGAPVFIPFMGAFIALKEAPRDAWIEAQVGVGGPLFGALGSLACAAIFEFTGKPLYGALAYSGFFLNLFNLAPFGFLDGGRIASALSPWLWLVGLVVMVAMMIAHPNPLLVFILIFSAPRIWSLFRKKTAEELRYFEVSAARRAYMAALYFGLIIMLVAGMHWMQRELPNPHS